MKYIRIVHNEPIRDVGFRAGFLNAVYRLRGSPEVSDVLYVQLSELIDWFNANLEIPEKFNRTSSKGAYRRNTSGLSWFKRDAKEHVAKAFEARQLLLESGIETDVFRTDRVGYIVYEDAHQVVAQPFSETPT